MLIRIKQFLTAITAEVSAADKKLISNKLNIKEQALFYAMNLPDQRHALNVAYETINLVKQRTDVDEELLLKCALLHDVGKIKGDVSTWDKIITVLAHKLAPDWAKKWGKYGQGGVVSNLRHAFYIYYNHPVRGAELLLAVGTDRKIAEIVCRHHAELVEGEPPELAVLRQADNMH